MHGWEPLPRTPLSGKAQRPDSQMEWKIYNISISRWERACFWSFAGSSCSRTALWVELEYMKEGLDTVRPHTQCHKGCSTEKNTAGICRYLANIAPQGATGSVKTTSNELEFRCQIRVSLCSRSVQDFNNCVDIFLKALDILKNISVSGFKDKLMLPAICCLYLCLVYGMA